jgi:hypothetical protein
MSVLLVGCSADNPLEDDFYTTNIYNGGDIETSTFSITTPVYASVDIPSSSMYYIGTNIPEWKPFNGVIAPTYVYNALADEEEEAYFIVEVPHNYVEGSDIRLYFHYVYLSDTVGESAKFGLEYTWCNQEALYPTSTTIYRTTTSTNNDSNYHHWVGFAPIDGTGKTIGSVLACRIFRNSSSVEDTYEHTVVLLEVDLIYQVDTLGSTLATVK